MKGDLTAWQMAKLLHKIYLELREFSGTREDRALAGLSFLLMVAKWGSFAIHSREYRWIVKWNLVDYCSYQELLAKVRNLPFDRLRVNGLRLKLFSFSVRGELVEPQ